MNDKIIEIDIGYLAGMGDGAAKYNGKNVLTSLTCAGDKVSAKILSEASDHIKAELLEVLTPSKDRQQPACQHFGKCGGCALQHLNNETYTNFKSNILLKIINDLDANPSIIKPLVQISNKSRRRADFKIKINKGDVSIGFFAKKSHDVVDLNECPVTEDKIMQFLPILKNCLQNLKKPGIFESVDITLLDSGLDVIFNLCKKIKTPDFEKLAMLQKEKNIARLSYKLSDSDSYENIYVGDAFIKFSNAEIYLPRGAFLQATKQGQQAITQFVLEHLKPCQNIADLYAGCGTYSFYLIENAKRVAAFEGDEQMISSMHNAASDCGFATKISTNTRDLFVNPLSIEELKTFDGVVINPPRNGALPQIKNLGKSGIKNIVMVSCNPSTFKRDAKALLESGYKMTSTMAIDQFLWSKHLEIVASFVKV